MACYYKPNIATAHNNLPHVATTFFRFFFFFGLVGTHDLQPLRSPLISLNRKGPWTKVKTKNMIVDV